MESPTGAKGRDTATIRPAAIDRGLTLIGACHGHRSGPEMAINLLHRNRRPWFMPDLLMAEGREHCDHL